MTLARRVEITTTSLTALTAVAALALSLVTTIQLNHKADVSLTLPNVIRLSQGSPQQGSPQVQITIQPTFTVDEKTDITSVVTSAHLNMTPPSQTNPVRPYFFWEDVLEFSSDTQADATVGKIVGDPAPIVITQNKPQAPIMRFIALSTALQTGRWKGALTAERPNQPPLVGEFCIDVSDDPMSNRPLDTLVMRNDDLSPSSRSSNCYHNAAR